MTLRYLLCLALLAHLVACTRNAVPRADGPPVPNPVTRTVHVSTAAHLQAALLGARAGDDIILADGTYRGRFVIEPGRSGTPVAPITLRGSRNAILDGGSTGTGYVLHLQGSHWNLRGFAVTNGLKGLMADGARNCVIDGLQIFTIGEEALHLRKFSSANTVQNCTITTVGLKTPDYGEGIYIGSAKSNWDTYTAGQPDRCDSNNVLANTIGPGITAECIDVKEGTTGGVIRGNRFDATGITGANSGDSWADLKGNRYLVEGNTGTNPGGTIFKDGYQVHVAFPGWGNDNEFRSNTSTVNASGYGFNIQLAGSNGTSTGNKVYTSNTVVGAARGISNIGLSN